VGVTASAFGLEPFRPEHNERDHAAWSSSIEHIRATPGFPDGEWPRPMSLESNLVDLVRHARDFAARDGFTYSVLEGDEVVGCVYIYSAGDSVHDARVVGDGVEGRARRAVATRRGRVAARRRVAVRAAALRTAARVGRPPTARIPVNPAL